MESKLVLRFSLDEWMVTNPRMLASAFTARISVLPGSAALQLSSKNGRRWVSFPWTEKGLDLRGNIAGEESNGVTEPWRSGRWMGAGDAKLRPFDRNGFNEIRWRER